MVSKYEKIVKLWEEAGSDLERPPHLEASARKLDELLSHNFQPIVNMWQDGLISAVEFVNMINHEAFKEDVL